MNEEQSKAFETAEQKTQELMSALYNIRNHFYINNKIPDSRGMNSKKNLRFTK